MTVQYLTSLRDNQLDSIEATIGTSPKLRIYTGAPPVNCAAAATGSLLSELSLPSDWMANASGGTKVKAGSWSGSASATGTAGYFRIWNTAVSVCHIQGTVGTSGTDMIVDSVSFNNGQAFTVLTFTMTGPQP